VGQHRLRPQRDGAAERLYRPKDLAVAQGEVAAAQQHAVLLFTCRRLIRNRPSDANQGEEQYQPQGPFHAAYPISDRNLRCEPGSKPAIVGSATQNESAFGDFSLKQARVATWSDIGGHEATLVQRCAAGEEPACSELVAEHQRMVVQLAINLLGDRDEALDLSQEVFFRVFRTIHRFRGHSSLRTDLPNRGEPGAQRHRFWRGVTSTRCARCARAAHGDCLAAAKRFPIGSRLKRSWPSG
jgi:hypothetical protein